MNQQQILEQMLSFSMQQHGIKDRQIEDLQKQVAELQKKLGVPAEPPKIAAVK